MKSSDTSVTAIRMQGEPVFQGNMVPVSYVTDGDQRYVEKQYDRTIPIEDVTFQRELTALSSVDHPNLTRLHRVIGDDRIQMPYIEGIDVREDLYSGPLSPEHAIETTLEVLQGLIHMHERGFYHRDIKPANILLTPKSAVLIDYGVAYHASVDHLEQSGMVLGTPHYVSPEHIQQKEDVDHRQDLYSLGLTLYEMLTGRKGVPGRTCKEVFRAHIHSRIIPPSDHSLFIPKGLSDIVLRACAKNPDDRYTCAEEMTEALLKAPHDPDRKVTIFDFF